MKKLFLIFVLTLSLSSIYSCEKEDESNDRESYELRFTNTSSNPYTVEVDGTTSSLSGKTFKNYDLEQGTYSWKVTQESGYLIYPTVKEGTVNLTGDREIVFP